MPILRSQAAWAVFVMYRVVQGLMLDLHVARTRQAAALPERACTAQVVGC
jgi:hypothetical protein